MTPMPQADSRTCKFNGLRPGTPTPRPPIKLRDLNGNVIIQVV
jgi:hypothetical protein